MNYYQYISKTKKMIKLTKVYPDYYGYDKTEPLYVDEKSIISVGKNNIRCCGLSGYYPYTEITLKTGDKHLVEEDEGHIVRLIEG